MSIVDCINKLCAMAEYFASHGDAALAAECRETANAILNFLFNGGEPMNMTYYTPKAVLDFIGESPLEIIPGERPLNAILMNPPLELITHSARAVGNTSFAQAKGPTSTGKLGGRA